MLASAPSTDTIVLQSLPPEMGACINGYSRSGQVISSFRLYGLQSLWSPSNSA